ncbi:MAG: endonuclease MutS2 [Cyclobacteriaceae bacterium]|nr:endonuclease MutS2 [Cyclobacteriaceae bacterium]
MIFPEEFERKLGFDQVRERLQQYCLGPLGMQQVDAMAFSSDFSEVKSRLEQNAEFKQILEKADEFPASHYYDTAAYFKTAAIDGSFLEEESFHEILLSLQTILACKKYLTANQQTLPQLFKLAEPVSIPVSLVSSIESKFDDRGQVRDNASAELAQIRKRLREEQSRVKRLADQIFRKAVEQGWVPEGAILTIRNGRPAIPIQAEHKRKLQGFILDESATGQTVFMEPAEVLDANNEIRDLLHADRREVIRILRELTSLLRQHLPALAYAYRFLGELDFARAKAKFALDIRAELPQMKPYPYLNWIQARHPLLFLSLRGKRDVVPLTIDLPEEQPFLLVSGPNAGGKSVCLKTVGLVQYMAQCGLLVPVHDKSTVGIFRKIFLDIGDQQSLENDLSTYSSHLQNMAFFLQNTNAQTLVLLDELGAGTDPNFGGGIAEAVLDGLLGNGAWGVATTHYYNLKLFAETHPHIRNGAMLFDTKQLGPLFQLEIGKPGSSFALEIARKTGLPAKTILKAEEIIGKELTGLETLMKTVADEKAAIEKRQREITQREKQLNEAVEKYESLSDELHEKKKAILEKAKLEAANLLKETNREIEKTIRHIKENKAEKKETKKVREGLQGLVEKVKLPAKQAQSQDKIETGDSVRLIGQEVSGKVISIKEDVALVEFGSLRSSVKLKQLIRSDQAPQHPTVAKARALGVDVMKKQSQFVSTLDIRGRRVEETNALLDQFLDDAMLLGQAEVKILHGKGEGVLRKVVRDRLKATKGVASFADEHVDRGGDGITVVVLK